MLNILLVEDNPGDARLTREALVAGLPDGFELFHADSIDGAFRHLDHARIDVILLDLQLPDAEGMAGLVALRARARAVPIIVLSGVSDDATALSTIVDGAEDFVSKNDSSSSLLARAVRYAINRRRAEGRAEHLRQHDALTDLANRPTLMAELARLVDQGTSRPFVLLHLDIDDFKAINAALGHRVGDQVLRAFGGRLRSMVRPEDFVARVGSDEFMVIVEGATRAAGVAIAQHILESLSRTGLPAAGHTIPVSAQVSVTCFPDQGLSVDAILRSAERALDLARVNAEAGFVHAETRPTVDSLRHESRHESRPEPRHGQPVATVPLSIVWAHEKART